MSLLAEILTPTEVINDTFVVVQDIECSTGEYIEEGADFISLETSKSIVSVSAPVCGYIELLCKEDDEVEVGSIIARIWSDESFSSNDNKNEIESLESNVIEAVEDVIISKAANQLINEHGISISEVKHKGLINENLVLQHLLSLSKEPMNLDIIDRNLKASHENILFVGTGLHANTLHTILNNQLNERRNLVGIITHDKKLVGAAVNGIEVIATEDQLSLMSLQSLHTKGVKIAIGYSFKDKRVCKSRQKLINLINESGIEAVNIVHRSAMIEPTANIGEGTQVAQGAIIGNNVKLGKGVIINSGAIVSHDCTIGDNTHIAPGAVLGGNVKIGDNCLVGMNSTLFADFSLDSDSFVANMSNLTSKNG
ncbi:biotin/lipoyl-containing protein [Vibrio splendidus]|uniref:biotin/lipoyl-containing protein n=1 Tax=Vibrio splendidus TaxID=29497 RepID=UPI00076ADA71|nr:biotin/lipoyl-containing protein [Vibrio splendidus]